MTDVMTRVYKHCTRAIEHYGEGAVLGVFLYGSWNYNTNTPDSDVDTKCILVPNLYSLAIKPYEVKHLYIDDEVCECMTLMHMVANWKKQNINFVEIMFTEYCVINPLYKKIWEEFFPLAEREKVARYDLRQAIHSMVHQAMHTLKQDPNDPKKIMNGARILMTLDRLTRTERTYKNCILMPEAVRDLRFQKADPHKVSDLLISLEEYLNHIDEYTDKGSFKPAVDRMLEELILKLIEYRISNYY
jgi:predicted nucleotidyltransferase